LGLGLWAFPIARWQGVFWIALIPLCATFAGVIFYAWQKLSRMSPPQAIGGSNARMG